MKECIIRMLEFADERELDLIYRFVLHLIGGVKASKKGGPDNGKTQSQRRRVSV